MNDGNKGANDISFAALKARPEDVLFELSSWEHQSLLEGEIEVEGTADGASPGFAIVEKASDVCETFEHSMNIYWESKASRFGEYRIVAFKDCSEWTFLVAPKAGQFGDSVTSVASQRLSREVFYFQHKVGTKELGSPNMLGGTGLWIEYPDASKRLVDVWDDYSHIGSDQEIRYHYHFRDQGVPHPAEDLSAYERRGPRNKLNASELVNVMHRLGFGLPDFSKAENIKWSVRISAFGDIGEPLSPLDTLIERLRL